MHESPHFPCCHRCNNAFSGASRKNRHTSCGRLLAVARRRCERSKMSGDERQVCCQVKVNLLGVTPAQSPLPSWGRPVARSPLELGVRSSAHSDPSHPTQSHGSSAQGAHRRGVSPPPPPSASVAVSGTPQAPWQQWGASCRATSCGLPVPGGFDRAALSHQPQPCPGGARRGLP